MLTTKYRSAFDSAAAWFSPRFVISFLRDVVRHGKAEELISYLAWECAHRLGLYPASSYLRFDTTEPSFTAESCLMMKANEPVAIYDVSITREEHPWFVFWLDAKRVRIGATSAASNRLVRGDEKENPTELFTFPAPIDAIFISSRDDAFIASGGTLYRGEAPFTSFDSVLTFSTPSSCFRHGNSISESPDGALVIGEYASVWETSGWRFAAYMYRSIDDGVHWRRYDFLHRYGVNKHVHLIRFSRILGVLLMTDGDNRKRLWRCENIDGAATEDERDFAWRRVTHRHSQRTGFTALVELDGTLMFGSDYLAGTNFIATTRDGVHYRRLLIPDPFRKAIVKNLLLRRNARVQRNEVWALVHAAFHSRVPSCVMMSPDGGATWRRIVEYDGTRFDVEMTSGANDPVDSICIWLKELGTGNAVTMTVTD